MFSPPRVERALAVAVTWACLSGIAFFVQGSATNLCAQGTKSLPVLLSRTQLVVVPVAVTDHNGNFVVGLTASEFTVLDNGKAQPISFFEQQNTPVTVGLLVDCSGSMRPRLAEVAHSVAEFARTSNPRDQVFVIDFADTPSIELFDGQPFTDDPGELERAVTAVSANGLTALYDAVAEGIVRVQFGRWNKRALVIVSDGGENASHHSLKQILQMAHSSDAAIYVIGLRSGAGDDPDVLRRLAHDTGGRVFFPGRRDSIAAASNAIARDLRSQYVLAFALPQETSTFHKLKIKVSSAGRGRLRVRARAGYTEADGPISGSATLTSSAPQASSESP